MRTFLFRCPVGLVALALVGSLFAAALPPDLDAFIEKGMEEWKLPGLAIAVVKDGRPILVKGYGVREAGKPEKVDGETLFAIGSTTKAFTATAMGMLVDRGRIRWNTRVQEIDPGLELSDPWVAGEIRISDLLANHSGLDAMGDSLWYGTGFSREEILERLKRVPFSEGFRYQYQYRNVMFLLAGMMIPKIADGRTWDDFLSKEMFEPLGMTRTWATDAGLEGQDNIARPHILDYEGAPVPMDYRDMHNIGPAGSIVSCAKDLVPWLKVNLGANGDLPLVSAETLRVLHSAHTPMWTVSADGEARVSPYPLNSYCLGWVTQLYEGHCLVWHNGNIDGMSAYVALLPEIGLGVAILTNLDDCEFRTVVFDRIARHFLGGKGPDRGDALLKRFRDQLAERSAVESHWRELAGKSQPAALPLADYAGDYENPVLGRVTVEVDGAHLRYARRRKQTVDLAVGKADTNTFLGRQSNANEDLRTGKVRVEFEVGDGVVERLVDYGDGIPMRFQRVAPAAAPAR